jgi:uncharacterized protein YegJ (DUF2314 family)
MVQVRCPECGYLQTLSEERFVAISDDYLNCPHCHAKVPKEWQPVPGETVPEETRHKMLAFSRRILNGRNVAREVVYALESLVRHYGPMEDSDKALGVGYAFIGEYKRAEEFLIRARLELPDDAQVLHSLIETFFAQEKYEDAVAVGGVLIQTLGSRARHEDVARLALALRSLGRSDEARQVMDSFPNLDSQNPLVKQARKGINRKAKSGLSSLFSETGPIRRLLHGASNMSVRKLGSPLGKISTKKSQVTKSPPVPPVPEVTPVAGEVLAEITENLCRFPVLMEYWVYAKESATPNWEDIRHALADQLPDRDEREHTFLLLEDLVDKDDLAIEYILKQDAPELFDYPEEMIPHNAKDFGEDDRKTLTEAAMIVRLRLSLAKLPEADYLSFMVRFVEAVRALTRGVVQDAVSHALWGTEKWTANGVPSGKGILESHVLLEVLDEDGSMWIHTHGMQKFGLPDLEMEGIPAELLPAGRKLLGRAIEALRRLKDQEINLRHPLELPHTPFQVALEFRPQDPEGHFPGGSLRLMPHIPGQDPEEGTTFEEALSLLVAQAPPKPPDPGLQVPEAPVENTEEKTPHVDQELREKLLNAHKKARKSLALFKKSFQEGTGAKAKVHAVKVGFPVLGGKYEWMWVSVGGWRGGSLVGHIENVPVLRKDLQHGGTVQISEDEIFDWAIAAEGKISQGAYTEGILA